MHSLHKQLPLAFVSPHPLPLAPSTIDILPDEHSGLFPAVPLSHQGELSLATFCSSLSALQNVILSAALVFLMSLISVFWGPLFLCLCCFCCFSRV